MIYMLENYLHAKKVLSCFGLFYQTLYKLFTQENMTHIKMKKIK